MTTRGRGVVRLWVKTCSDYDAQDNPAEVLYQTVYDGKVFEIRATPDEVVFFVSPRHQVRAVSAAVLEAVSGAAGTHADAQAAGRPGSDGPGLLPTLEEALDRHFLDVGKPESVTRFGALAARFELRSTRGYRHESPAPGGSGSVGTPGTGAAPGESGSRSGPGGAPPAGA